MTTTSVVVHMHYSDDYRLMVTIELYCIVYNTSRDRRLHVIAHIWEKCIWGAFCSRASFLYLYIPSRTSGTYTNTHTNKHRHAEISSGYMLWWWSQRSNQESLHSRRPSEPIISYRPTFNRFLKQIQLHICH